MIIEMLLVLIVLVPGLLLLVELTLSILTKQSNSSGFTKDSEKSMRLAIVMPAHNEEAVVAKAVTSIHDQLTEGDLLVVVADNCSDATADIVRDLELAHVVVLERRDTVNRGKGFALDHGHSYLKQRNIEFDTLGVIDSDCVFAEQDAVDHIKQYAKAADLFQVGYLMQSNANTSLLSSFAWFLKTASRSIGMMKLFGACHIQGSGFFISSKIATNVDFASGSIVEDLELGLNMAEKKVFCKYLPSVTLLSEMPSDVEVLQTQKSRWEVGHLKVLIEEALPRAWRAIKQGNVRYLLLVCDLSVPPLITYLAGLVVLMCVLALFTSIGALMVFACLLTFLPLLYLHWKRFCSLFEVDFAFSQIVAYVLVKFKVITNYSNKKSRAWNKTER